MTLSCAFEHDQRMVVLCGDLVDRRNAPAIASAEARNDTSADSRNDATGNTVIRLHL